MKTHFSTVIQPSSQFRRFVRFVRLAACSGLVLSLWLGLSAPAHAVDGCKLLLCMAGNWKNIGQCEPTVRQALRDAARGRSWPACSMGGSSASANQYVAPQQCAPQYRTSWEDRNGNIVYSCPYSGVIHVAIEGQAWSRTWWSPSGDSVVEWLPAAKAAFAGKPDVMDDQFERDYAIWAISEQGRLAADSAAEAASAQGGGW